VETVLYGQYATVTNVGTENAAVLNFAIPTGASAWVEVGSTTTGEAGSDASVTNSGSTQHTILDFTIPRGDKGEKGDKGDTGSAATISVGTVTTGAAGSSAAVTNAGTTSAAKFNFTIPQGAKGDKGDDGYTPVKGTDYFTDADKSELESDLQTWASGQGYATTAYVDEQIGDISTALDAIINGTST
jgi:hypothetical protein